MINHSKGTSTSIRNLSIIIRGKTPQVRKSVDVEHSLNASFKAAGKATEGNGGLDEDGGAVLGGSGKNRDDSKDNTKLDV